MISLFAVPGRLRLLVLLGVALAELAATILVARSLHGHFHQATVAILATATIAAFALQVLQRRLCEGVGLSYSAEVRKRLFRHLMSADPELVKQRRHGAMLQSFVGDLTALRQWVSEGLMRGILAVVALGGMLAWLGLAQPRLAMLLGGIAIAIIALGAVQLPLLAKAVRAVRRERGRVSSLASERLAAQPTVQAFGRGRSEAKRLDKRVTRMNRAAFRRSWLTGSLRALPHLATTAMLVTVVLVGHSGGTTSLAGNFVVVGILSLAIRDLARAGELLIPGRVAMARIQRLLEVPVRPRHRNGGNRDVDETGLVIDRLRLHAQHPALSATAAAGDLVLLEGDSDLLRGLFAVLSGRAVPEGGTVRWNGRDILCCRPSRRRRLVGIASPDLPLLVGSAALNIRYRASWLGEDEVHGLAGPWGVDPRDRNAMPNRVNLLRALAGSPPLLLLDLATTPLPDEDLTLLRKAICDWAGVVLVTGQQEAVQQLATRRWRIDRNGLVETLASALPRLHLVELADQRDSA